MSMFRVGDKVRVVDNSDCLNPLGIGSVHVVNDVTATSIKVDERWYYNHRFELVEDKVITEKHKDISFAVSDKEHGAVITIVGDVSQEQVRAIFDILYPKQRKPIDYKNLVGVV